MKPTNTELLERILRENGVSEIDTRKIVESAKEHFPSFYELENKIEGLESKIETLEAENATFSESRDRLIAVRKQLDDKIEKLEAENAAISGERMRLHDSIKEIIAQRDYAFTERDKAYERRNAALKEREKADLSLATQLSEAKRQLQTEKEVTKKLQESYEKLELEKKGLEADVRILTKQRDAHVLIWDKVKMNGEDVLAAVEERDQLRKECERLQREKQSDLAGEVAFQKARVNSLLSAVKILSDFL